jgi:spoIIIJ-associated protein
MTDQTDAPDQAETSDELEPVEGDSAAAEGAEPTQPTQPTPPTEPTGVAESTESTESTEDVVVAADTDADEEVDANVDEDGDDEADKAVDTESTGGGRLKDLESEGDIAADYLEELLDIADLDGDLDMDVEGDRAAVSIVGEGLDTLVGPDGDVLEALQELTRLAVYRETGERSRLMLDIGGFRAEVRKNLVVLAEEAVEDVRESGEAVKLAPMSPFERKVVHDAVAAAGLRSESEGVEPTRCVVIHPAD